jgi:light-regulated signal transduction histidine kinase (bacteriophytochrome)
MKSEQILTGADIAALGHSLRTPVNHLIGYSELLLEDPRCPEAARRHLNAIRRFAQEILVSIQQFVQDSYTRDGEMAGLRQELQAPLAGVSEAIESLQAIEHDQRLQDVQLIQYAGKELLAFLDGVRPPKTPPLYRNAQKMYPGQEAKASARFLVVDDSEATREMLCRMLERQGHMCTAVGSGSDALEHLSREHFDMVLLDLMMPETDGLEVLKIIKAKPELKDTAVVMLSAFDEVAEIGKCLEAGADDYLLKPIDRVLLNARLFAILERQRLLNLERKRTEELERADGELRRSNEELRRFASVVSHDLQEPLRMVTSYMQLLQRSLGESMTSDQAEYIKFAVDGASQMSSLIDDLLAYSRVSIGELRAETVDCNKVLDEAKTYLRTAIEESNAQISSSPLPKVLADAPQVRQLFVNLLGNAIKYRGQKSPHIRVSAEPEGSMWRFAVADNGIGISKDHLGSVFQMFLRLHDRSVPGTGIGLAICHRVVERFGGRIWAESREGEGSTFYFTLPCVNA